MHGPEAAKKNQPVVRRLGFAGYSDVRSLRSAWEATQSLFPVLPLAPLSGMPWQGRPRGRRSRRRGSGGRRLDLRRRGASDGALQINKIADGRGAINMFAAQRTLAFDGALIVCLLDRGKLFAVRAGGLGEIRKLVGQGLDARPRYFPTHRSSVGGVSNVGRNLPQGVNPVAVLRSVSDPGRCNWGGGAPWLSGLMK